MADLCLCQAEGQTTDLELFGELSHLIKVDTINYHTIVRTAANGVFNHTQHIHIDTYVVCWAQNYVDINIQKNS